MFAYCLNNPVAHRDSEGTSAIIANPAYRSFDDLNSGVGAGPGTSIGGGGIPIGVAVGVMIGHAVDFLWNTVSQSYSRSTPREYRSPQEVHHLVAKKAWNAAPAAAILKETLPGGVENPINKMSIKTGLHRRLHTSLYYGIANAIVISSYYSAETEMEQQSNVISALAAIRVIVYTLDKMAPY